MNTSVKKKITVSAFYDGTLFVKDRHAVRTLYNFIWKSRLVNCMHF